MTKLVWDQLSERKYEFGVDRGVLYPRVGSGVPWNGLVSVTEGSSASEAVANYFDGVKFLSKQDLDSFSASLVAFFYPEQLDTGAPFGLSYRTMLSDGENYKLHIVFNAFADPTEETHNSINASVEVDQFTWNLTTIPRAIPGHKPSAHFIVDTRIAYPWVITELESYLYGSEGQNPSLPSVPVILDMFENASILKITDHGDGTWTAETREDYPDIIQMLSATEFQITWPSAVYLDAETYTISSL